MPKEIKNEGDIIIVEPTPFVPIQNYVLDNIAYVFVCEEVYDELAKHIMNFIIDINFMPQVTDIYVIINSPGGSIFSGMSIYNILKSTNKRVTTCNDGYSCSMGSIIFCAGDVRIAEPHSLLMIHNPHGGEENALVPIKQSLIDIYLTVMPNITADELSIMMDEEKWLNYKEQSALGILTALENNEINTIYTNVDSNVTNISQMHGVFNSIIKNKYSNMSKEIKNDAEMDPEEEKTTENAEGGMTIEDLAAKIDSLTALVQSWIDSEDEEETMEPEEKAEETEEDPAKKEEEAKIELIAKHGFSKELKALSLDVIKDLVAKSTSKVTAKAIEINIGTGDVSIINNSKVWEDCSIDEKSKLVENFKNMNTSQRTEFMNKNLKLYSKVFMNSGDKK